MRLRRAARLAVVATALALAGGCSVDLPGSQPPPKLFSLTPKSTFATDLPPVKWQLAVETPVSEAGLNTARMALSRAPLSLEYFERTSWIDTAPQMVQTLLVQSFENTGRIVAVARQSVGLRPDYSLLTELREFQADYREGANPVVRVRISAKLVKMPQRSIIASTSAEHHVQAGSSSLEEVVKAFDAALGKTLKQVVEWTLRAAPPKPVSPKSPSPTPG